ncbi:MAG: DNA translocase FtsK [Bacteroidales bacterium]|nr:DNA translocase FtsK [Bacteroidales bacterium]
MSKVKEENSKKQGKSAGSKAGSKTGQTDERIRFIIGILITGFALYLLLSCISYLFSWKPDLSLPDSKVVSGPEIVVKNWGGKGGHFLAKIIIRDGFGFGAFFIPLIFGVTGLRMLNFPKIKPLSLSVRFAFAAIILSLLLGYIFGPGNMYLGGGPGGAHGHTVIKWMNAFMGKPGTGIVLGLITIAYMIFALSVHPSRFRIGMPAFMKKMLSPKDGETVNGAEKTPNEGATTLLGGDAAGKSTEPEFVVRDRTRPHEQDDDEEEQGGEHEEAEIKVKIKPVTGSLIHDIDKDRKTQGDNSKTDIEIRKPEPADILQDEEVTQIMENYDPRLDLSKYKFPPVSLLKEHNRGSTFDNSEVIENKDKIIKTLGDYKISIQHISATVGPTVTLYELIPERGVKLARIKSLEDDIALNLSAIGIRIIAPIPGRGTVGIEVPNKKPEIVSMRSLIASKAFQETKFDIALALGRTITNDPYIVDLTKMPHLLVAGATGQGKSVGLNAIITSIIYKKHPSELKFVLIDPKRVELPLYAKIERHYLAKLPGEEDAIITDTQKVINTLYSLCIEMDNRLELLKGAQVRNIKEYNEKFISRRLNPEKGHRFLPYIVLVIDEFADLIMTAGREIEGPIGRLAQVARAIGIHLIISTQRPTTNIITGFIKANFPTRIAFRVFSSIDSRTILDVTGADRLIGNGDMLISSGAEPVRVQCAFIDTSEIEELTEFIGSQQGFPDALYLPEYIDDGDAGSPEVDLRKRDPMFDEAARLVVQHQQGSTSLIQRKLSIGYNRAGRIIDQLEAAGIVGPFEGSKARDVLCTDIIALEQILKNLE